MPAGLAAQGDRCAPRTAETVVARSTRAVLFEGVAHSSLWGCSRVTGRRRFLGPAGEAEGLGVRLERLAGTRVAFVAQERDRYGAVVERLVLTDALHPRARVLAGPLDRDGTTGPLPFAAAALGPRGDVAWVQRAGGATMLRRRRPGDVARVLDQGFSIGAPRLAADGRLRWRHGAQTRTAGGRSGTDRCAPPAARLTLAPESTSDVDVVRGGGTVTVCWRATGAATTVEGGGQPAAVAGSWIAAAGDAGTIEVRDLAGGDPSRSVAVPGRAGSVVVDEQGAIAWTTIASTTAPGTQIWVDDADGAHQVATAASVGTRVVRDGSTVAWGTSDRYVLAHR